MFQYMWIQINQLGKVKKKEKKKKLQHVVNNNIVEKSFNF